MNQLSVAFDIPKLPFIRLKLCFSDEVAAETYFTASGVLDPQFEYGLPEISVAILGIQLFYVKELPDGPAEEAPIPELDSVPDSIEGSIVEPKPDPVYPPKPKPPLIR